MFEEDGEVRLVFTRRASNLRSHRGEVAFPGGRLEPGEEALEAALREAAEEIGLDPALVEVVGELGPLATATRSSYIIPFVGALDVRPTLAPNPAEVERVFDVALCELLDDSVYREERWDLPGMPDWPIHFFEVEGDTIWGATARILWELFVLVLVTGRRPPPPPGR